VYKEEFSKMRLSDIEKKARAMGLKDTWKFSRKELILMIQKAEGNEPCFGTDASCDQLACCWRNDCIR